MYNNSNDIKFKIEEVKFKNIVIFKKNKRKTHIVQEAGKVMDLVDECVGLCSNTTKRLNDSFKEQEQKIKLLNTYFRSRPDVDSMLKHKHLRDVVQNLSDCFLYCNCEKAFRDYFKKTLERISSVNEQYRKNHKSVIRDIITSGNFKEKEMLSTISNAQSEINNDIKELNDLCRDMFNMFNILLRASDEVAELKNK